MIRSKVTARLLRHYIHSHALQLRPPSQLAIPRGLLLSWFSIVAFVAFGLLPGCDSSQFGQLSSTPVPYASGGIGLTKAEWEKIHKLYDFNERDYYRYDVTMREQGRENYYLVDYWRERGKTTGTSRIFLIALSTELRLTNPKDSPGGEVQKMIKDLLPADAKYVKQMYPGEWSGHDIYQSETLKSLYPPIPGAQSPWDDGEPGTVHVFYAYTPDTGSAPQGGRASLAITAGIRSPPAMPPTTPEPTVTINIPTEVPTVLRPLPTGSTTPSVSIPSPLPSRPLPVPTGPAPTIPQPTNSRP